MGDRRLPEFRNEPTLDFAQAENRRRQTEALEAVRGRLGREYDLWIGSERLKSPERFASINASNRNEASHITGHRRLITGGAVRLYRGSVMKLTIHAVRPSPA